MISKLTKGMHKPNFKWRRAHHDDAVARQTCSSSWLSSKSPSLSVPGRGSLSSKYDWSCEEWDSASHPINHHDFLNHGLCLNGREKEGPWYLNMTSNCHHLEVSVIWVYTGYQRSKMNDHCSFPSSVPLWRVILKWHHLRHAYSSSSSLRLSDALWPAITRYATRHIIANQMTRSTFCMTVGMQQPNKHTQLTSSKTSKMDKVLCTRGE